MCEYIKKVNELYEVCSIILLFLLFELYSQLIFVKKYSIKRYFMELNFHGILIGVATFLIIGLFHPLVIKSEYYIGVKSWWLFLVLGIITLAVSLVIENNDLSILFGVVAFSSFWSIGEVFEQKKRVEKGWFPANPKRKK